MIFHSFKSVLILRIFSQNIFKRHSHSERKVRVNNIDINIVESGKGEKSVLLLPGALGSSWTDFKPQIEQLPQLLPNHTIIAWDPPGYGKSIPPNRQWGLDFFQRDALYAVNLMKTLGRKQFSVVGWSDGGITGLIAADKFSKNIEKLIIWGTGAYINLDEVKALEKIRDVQKWSIRMRQPMEAVYGEKRFAELWSEWVEAVKLFYQNCDGDFCKKSLQGIKAPTFILHGKKDPMIAPEHIPYLLNKLKDVKYYEFPNGKHNIHLRYAHEFNKIVANFILNNHES